MLEPRLFLPVLVLLGSVSHASAQTPPPSAPSNAQAAPASPAAAADVRFGIVNLQAVFNESDLGKRSLVQVTELRDRLRTQLEARARDIQGLAEKIKTQSAVASETTIVSWNVDLLRQQREAQFAQQEADIQVQQLQNALLESFQARIAPVVETLRVEKGLSAVFGVQGSEAPGTLTLLAIDPRVNLSAEVVARLNAQG